jgi:glyoxylase-like metal-dependent hydrolase (beta-lactamase superfamily II)
LAYRQAVANRDVFFVTSGTFAAPAFAVGRPGFSSTPLSNTVAVIVRSDDSLVLVDAGLSETTCANPGRGVGHLRARFLGIRASAEDSVAAQLERRGYGRDRVSTIIATHLHFDHVNGVRDFPNAELVVSREELDAFSSRRADFGYDKRDLNLEQRIVPVELEDGPREGFARSLDVFEDESVHLLDARGHTPGSIAVSIASIGAHFIHVGDAVYNVNELDRNDASPISRMIRWNAERHRACADVLRAAAKGATLVPSHDADTFAKLPKGPTSSSATPRAPASPAP